MAHPTSTYVVHTYLTYDALTDKKPDGTWVFVPEPGETYTASVRAESFRRQQAIKAGHGDTPAWQYLECHYRPLDRTLRCCTANG